MHRQEKLRELLLTEMSRRNTDIICGLVFQKPELFDQLFTIFAGNRETESRRAAWVLDIVSEKMPELLVPHADELVGLLTVFKHDGLKRHSLHMLSRLELPDGDRLGILINTCFNWLLSPGEAVAAKMYCMEILYRISQREPDLKKELADSIEWRLDEETPGFKNHGQKVLKRLYLEMKERTEP